MRTAFKGKRCFVLTICCIIMLLTHSNGFSRLSIPEIAQKYSTSIVTIIGFDENSEPIRYGTGFFINNSGLIATNSHILEHCSNAMIKTKNKIIELNEIVAQNDKIDLLIAKTAYENNLALPLGDSDNISVGEDIVAIGNPQGLEGTVSKGNISAIRKHNGIKYIQITAPISSGSSGGPV